MGIGHDGLRAEAERDAHNEAVETLRQLLLWSDTLGGWEGAAWERARAVVAKADAAKGAPDLLAALRAIEQRLAPCAVYGAPATCDAVALARAAIAKAESK